MKKTFVIIILLLTILVSCIDKPELETGTGKNIIPKDTLELMIYDIHFADAIILSNVTGADSFVFDSLVYQEIYDKYNYTREDFDLTLLYYSHNSLDTLNQMYDRIIEKLYVKKGEINL